MQAPPPSGDAALELPVTSLTAGACAVLAVLFGLRVVLLRRRHGVALGHGQAEELERAIRLHGNFLEHAPLVLVLIALLELQRPGSLLLPGAAGTFLLARLLHAWALMRTAGAHPARVVGMILSWAVTLLLGVVLIAQGTLTSF